MQYNVVARNPFAVLTAIVAPAILTNASSVLALGTSNRLARVVDRTRIVAAQLAPLHVRAQLLVKALRLFYAGLGLFAASALVSVGGSIETFYGCVVAFYSAATLAVLTGASAVFGLCAGCVLMVREPQIAVKSLDEEAKTHAGLHHQPRPPR